jgi:putative peptidoglycan lipid II flippase
MALSHAVAGPDPGLELSGSEQAILGLSGTLGVAAFVAVPTVALWRGGFSLRPRWAPRSPGVRHLLGLSSWAVLQHTGAALLLGAAIVLGAAVEGGVIAYRVAFYLFLAPYGIFAQPIHTTVQPELADDATAGDLGAFGGAVRWSLASLGVVVVPVAALMVAMAQPAMEVIAFGQADAGDGIDLMAAGLAGLALGLPAYGAFRLFAAAWYALDDSRTPALAAVGSAVVGVVLMAGLATVTEGAARIFSLGVGHTVGFLLGAAWLAFRLRRHQVHSIWPRSLPVVTVLAAVLAGGAWVAIDAWAPDGRWLTALAIVVVSATAGLLYYAGIRGLHLLPGPLARPSAMAS